uniref:NADH-ubiquinone oxidoreductase chain 2 n=1 Tax=Troglophilus neglectus TaxID=552514 RepID=B6DED9_TRONE|nr:NADH dehydrogenase subunit 2 [Troglophilus neglectus]ACG59335.1 NADH dehydrogenase subunit 2 [Troglophilus neglectus]
MFNNPTKILFLTTLVGGTIIAISSNSWLGAWMGLEINLLSFIPLMTNSKNLMSTEASMKYFLVQALASTILLFSVIFMHFMTQITLFMSNEIFSLLISSTLLLKMGAAPFHFWFPGVMEGLNWMNCLILMTWQKIAPLMLFSYCVKINTFTSIIIITSVIVGSLGGLNQTSMRKIMAYSSINHLGWMIAAMISGNNLWLFYFSIYSFLSVSLIFLFNTFQTFHISQGFLISNKNSIVKFSLFLLLLSLGGLPPFLGFLPKWLVIQTLTEHNLIFTITTMVITTLLTLFYYLRISFSSFLISYAELKWNNQIFFNNQSFITLTVLSTISTTGLIICTILFSLF